MGIKNSIPRLDAVDKVTGAAKYTEDLKWNSTRY